jgi:hypothetical protein
MPTSPRSTAPFHAAARAGYPRSDDRATSISWAS